MCGLLAMNLYEAVAGAVANLERERVMRNLTSKSGLLTGVAAAALLVLAGCDQASEDAAVEDTAEPIAATEEEAATEDMIEEAADVVEEQTGDALNELETAAGEIMDEAEEAAGDMVEETGDIVEEAEEAAEETVEETSGE